MSSVNGKPVMETTFGGGQASRIGAKEKLERTLMTCMLWEDNFYEDGESVADRIKRLVKQVGPKDCVDLLRKAKFENKLRHAPLYMIVCMLDLNWFSGKDGLSANVISDVITRPDDITELLALYWQNGKRPLSKKLVKGIQSAFKKFDEYQLAKYKRESRSISLRDAMKITRPKPENDVQNDLWKRFIAQELKAPATWEVQISACGSDSDKKKTVFENLIKENKLGDLALLRNLRKMLEVGVDETLLKQYISTRKWNWIIPYQFISAAKYAPKLEPQLEQAMFKSLESDKVYDQKVRLLVDVSGSMCWDLSGTSEVKRYEVASSLAILIREKFSNCDIFTFNSEPREVPARRGFALKDVITQRIVGGTQMWGCIRNVSEKRAALTIVITDEQTDDVGKFSDANSDDLVIINVANYEKGVAYDGKTIHINGWSDKIVSYIEKVVLA